MGALESLFQGLSGERETKILMLGLKGAGKTTILEKLQLGEFVTTITPIDGFTADVVKSMNISCTVWDIGGLDKMRPAWRQYFTGTSALIFVVDSNDRGTVIEAKQELSNLLNEDELIDAVLLVYANKQDLPNSMPIAVVTEKLGLHNVRNRNWYIHSASATSGDGLFEGLEELCKQVKAKK